MKSYAKGVLTGFLIAAAICAVGVAAENIDAVTANLRVNIDGNERVSYGTEVWLDDYTSVPYSLIYNGTVYLPLRKMGELFGKEAYWNGDTQTVTLADSMSGKRLVAQKPDANGNVWEYATFTAPDGCTYLRVSDTDRGYSRLYITASNSVRVTSDAIYFARLSTRDTYKRDNRADLVKISFASTPDTQDGEALYALNPITAGGFVIDGEYAVYTGLNSDKKPAGQIMVLNYEAAEDFCYNLPQGHSAYNLKLKESSTSRMVLQYSYDDGNGNVSRMEIAFNKNSKMFGQPRVIG